MLSIVTATMGLIEKDVENLLNFYNSIYANCDRFEILIQDAGSDSSLISRLRERDYVDLVSEPDSGIYDAWNRALKRVKGDRITFLGIDDLPTREWVEFASGQPGSIENFVIACDVVMLDDAGERLGVFRNPRRGKLDTRANRFAHPGLVFSRDIFAGREFPTTYRIIGDLVFYSQFDNLEVVHHLGGVGVSMQLGGISNSPNGTRRVLKEYCGAILRGDAPAHLPLLAKRMASAALSISPTLYLHAQRRRWQRAAE